MAGLQSRSGKFRNISQCSQLENNTQIKEKQRQDHYSLSFHWRSFPYDKISLKIFLFSCIDSLIYPPASPSFQTSISSFQTCIHLSIIPTHLLIAYLLIHPHSYQSVLPINFTVNTMIVEVTGKTDAWEPEAAGLLQAWGQSESHSKFQDNLGYRYEMNKYRNIIKYPWSFLPNPIAPSLPDV